MLATGVNIEKKTVRWPLTRLDIAGAFGDIGVLFPLAIALITLNHMNPTAVFLTAGLAYIITGAYFQIPMPVQPFKAVAAIALAMSLSPSAIASAGLLMGILLALVGVTGLATRLAKLFSLPIIRGIQLGLGLLLAREGLRLMLGWPLRLPLANGPAIPGWGIALGGILVLLIFQRSRRFPAALVLLIGGSLLGLLVHAVRLPSIGWGPVPFKLLHPRAAELTRVLMLLVIPQFALTFGNSIVATENTAKILYGPQARRVTLRALSLAIGITNILGGMLMSAPTCHGSGGVTAHYNFGARTQKSTYFIGGVCLLLGLFGGSAVGILELIPRELLGVFLVYVGVQHAAYLRDISTRASMLFIAVCVGLVSITTTNLMWGFLAGFAIERALRVIPKVRGNSARPEESAEASEH